MRQLLTLKKNFEFQKVFKKGKWYGGDFLCIYVLPTKKGENYIGIAVSKRFSKSSVKRNRVRRLIRESFRIHQDSIFKGYHIVIVLKADVLFEQVNFHVIEQDLIKCFNKAGIWITKEGQDGCYC